MSIRQPHPQASTTDPSSRAATIVVGVGLGLVVPIIGTGLAYLALDRSAGDGHMANFIPITLLGAACTLLGPLILLIVGAASRTRESLRLLATACFAAAITWVVIVLVGCSGTAVYTWWLSTASEPYPY